MDLFFRRDNTEGRANSGAKQEVSVRKKTTGSRSSQNALIGYSPRRYRIIVSAERRVVGVTCPILSINRALETNRMSSHWIKLGSERPPSGGGTATWEQMCLARVVRGRPPTRSGPRINGLTERMSAGRFPPWSCPIGVPRSTHQISPRRGESLLMRPPIRQRV